MGVEKRGLWDLEVGERKEREKEEERRGEGRGGEAEAGGGGFACPYTGSTSHHLTLLLQPHLSSSVLNPPLHCYFSIPNPTSGKRQERRRLWLPETKTNLQSD